MSSVVQFQHSTNWGNERFVPARVDLVAKLLGEVANEFGRRLISCACGGGNRASGKHPDGPQHGLVFWFGVLEKIYSLCCRVPMAFIPPFQSFY